MLYFSSYPAAVVVESATDVTGNEVLLRFSGRFPGRSRRWLHAQFSMAPLPVPTFLKVCAEPRCKEELLLDSPSPVRSQQTGSTRTIVRRLLAGRFFHTLPELFFQIEGVQTVQIFIASFICRHRCVQVHTRHPVLSIRMRPSMVLIRMVLE